MAEQAKLDRRGFLAGAAGLTGVALSVGAWKPVFAAETEVPSGVRSLVPAVQRPVAFITFKLDEVVVGTVSSAVGGNATAEVISGAVNQKTGPGVFPQKHIANVKYEEITLQTGVTMDKRFFDWIASASAGQPVAHSGVITGATENFKIISQTNFVNAMITEIGFPPLDAASKDAAKMTIKFQPALTHTSTPLGSATPPAASSLRHDKWLVSNFKLTINGMNTSGVSKIDALNLKLNYVTEQGETQKLPFFRLTSVDVPNMKITIASSQAADWTKWHTDFVVKGNNSFENQKTGVLSFLSTDHKTEFFRLNLAGVGIFALDPDPLVVGQTELHTTAQLFVNNMKLNFRL